MNEFEKIDKKRVVCLIVCLFGAFIVGLAYTWSVLQAPFVQQLGGSAVTGIVVLGYTATVLASTMSPSIFGSIIKKWGPGKTIRIGAVLFGIGYILSGYATSITWFFIGFGLCTGIGSGLIYPTIMGYMASLYPDRQGIVSGTIAGIYGGAAIIWSPLMAYFIENSGLGHTLLVIGIISIVAVMLVSLIIQPVPNGYIEYKRSHMQQVAGKKANRKTGLPDLTRSEMVKTGMFYVAILAFACGCTSGMMVMSQISVIMQQSFAMSATQAATYVSLLSFMSMTGRFIWGTVTDHFNKYVTLSIICGFPIITMGILGSSHSMMLSIVCLAITALCYGGFGSIIVPITSELFGSEHVSDNYGVMYLAFGFAALVGPQLAVKLEHGGDYSMAFTGASIISVIAFVMTLIVGRRVRGNENRLKSMAEE